MEEPEVKQACGDDAASCIPASYRAKKRICTTKMILQADGSWRERLHEEERYVWERWTMVGESEIQIDLAGWDYIYT